MHQIEIRRVYDGAPWGEGRALLVDRVWPRGIRKADLAGVVWLKDVAPTRELRQWFDHRPERWEAFRRRYFDELDANPASAALREMADQGPVTLLYGARDEIHNQAAALRDYLLGRRP